jgi:hypothetical protein
MQAANILARFLWMAPSSPSLFRPDKRNARVDCAGLHSMGWHLLQQQEVCAPILFLNACWCSWHHVLITWRGCTEVLLGRLLDQNDDAGDGVGEGVACQATSQESLFKIENDGYCSSLVAMA